MTVLGPPWKVQKCRDSMRTVSPRAWPICKAAFAIYYIAIEFFIGEISERRGKSSEQ